MASRASNSALLEPIFWLMILSLYFPTNITSIFAIFELTSAMGLQDTKTGLILPYTALHLPIYMFVMHTIFKQIPRELEEAASIDGASPYQTFWQHHAPVSRDRYCGHHHSGLHRHLG